jgi:RNA polymerase sigma-70 factor (ECF subfamily)
MLAIQEAIPAPSSPLERLFCEHHARVFRAAYRVTGNASDAEDVLQTVFLRLARGGGGESLEKPASYLYRAALNAALDVVRRRRLAEPLEAADGAVAAEGTPALLDVAELRRALRRALTGLSPRAAEMFALRYFEGLGNGEIARQMGTSSAVVAVTLFRARRRMQNDLRRLLAGRR